MRDVQRIDDVAFAELLLVAHVEHQRAFTVDQPDELLRRHGLPAALHFVA